MAARVADSDVREVISLPADAVITAFITAANLMVNKIPAKFPGVLDDATLFEVERWTAAHLASVRYSRLTSQSVGDGQEAYRKGLENSIGLQSTTWGQQAIMLDTTGTLAELAMAGSKLGVMALGTARSLGQDLDGGVW